MAFSVSVDGSVCSLMRISGFGGKTAWGYNKSDGYNTVAPACTTLPEFLKLVLSKIDYYNSISLAANKFWKQGLVVVYLTSVQTEGLGVIREFGGWQEFSSKGMKKYDHELISFTMTVQDFMDRFDEHAKALKLSIRFPRPESAT